MSFLSIINQYQTILRVQMSFILHVATFQAQIQPKTLHPMHETGNQQFNNLQGGMVYGRRLHFDALLVSYWHNALHLSYIGMMLFTSPYHFNQPVMLFAMPSKYQQISSRLYCHLYVLNHALYWHLGIAIIQMYKPFSTMFKEL